MIVAFSGPPCSGKSTLGRLLAASRNMVHLEMDTFRVRILPNAAHTREDRRVAYCAMHFAAELLASRGHSVIVNASYSHEADRQDLEAVAVAANVALFLIECTVTVEVAVARSRERRATHPGLDLTDQRVAGLVVTFPFFGAGLTIDSTVEVAACMARIEDYLSAGRGLPLGRWPAAATQPA